MGAARKLGRGDDPMGYRRNRPSPEGAALGEQLARLTEPGLRRQRTHFPDGKRPCESCAFRKGSVPNRCLATVADALKCVVELRPFYCHQTLDAAGHPTELCAGYVAALSCLPAAATPAEMPYDFSQGD